MEGSRTRDQAILVFAILILSTARYASAARVQDPKKPNPPGQQGLGKGEYLARNCRAHEASLKDFGGVGDGKTLNTKAFQDAIKHLSQFQNTGGSFLYVPPGKYLTGPFNLTSHFTLYLDKDAVLIAPQDVSMYTVIEPLPSYGRGRDEPGPRYISLIFGDNLTDVVITGNNGTLDGQGKVWWDKYDAKQLKLTRPYLIEIMHSTDVQISNINLLNSMSWNIHPVYCDNVIIRDITIIAALDSRNTDGINPDSCTNTIIEDCYIQSGDDCVAVKSGWNQYGIAYGKPSKDIVIRRLTCISPTSAMVAIGSEMSGGIENVMAEDLHAINTETAVTVKTVVGRGNYIRNIFVRNVRMDTMKNLFRMIGVYTSNPHPDDKYDRKAIPVVENLNYRDMVAKNVTQPGRLNGIPGTPFKNICMSNITAELSKDPDDEPWECKDIVGITSGVTPAPCKMLPDQKKAAGCDFPTRKLPIESVKLQKCTFRN